MEPSPGWVKALCEAHRERPDDAVVGGPIAFPRPGEKPTRLEWADYLSEYGEQIPAADSRSQGLSANSSPEKLSGANCSYKRWALDACEDLISEGAWETAIHQRLAGQGFGLSRAPGAYVCYYKPGHWRELIDQRFHYGRDHGAERLREAGWARRLAQVSAAPLVPWLLLGRLWRRAPAGSDIRGQVLAAAGWLLALYGAWALGEAVGAWFAPDREEKHVF